MEDAEELFIQNSCEISLGRSREGPHFEGAEVLWVGPDSGLQELLCFFFFLLVPDYIPWEILFLETFLGFRGSKLLQHASSLSLEDGLMSKICNAL